MKKLTLFFVLLWLILVSQARAFTISGVATYGVSQVFDTVLVEAWPDTQSFLKSDPTAFAVATAYSTVPYSYNLLIDTPGVYYLFAIGDIDNDFEIDLYEPTTGDTPIPADISVGNVSGLTLDLYDYPPTNSGVAIELMYSGTRTGQYIISVYQQKDLDTEPSSFIGEYEVGGPDTYPIRLVPGIYGFEAFIDEDWNHESADTEAFGMVGLWGDTPVSIVAGSTPVIQLPVFDPPVTVSGDLIYNGTAGGNYIVEVFADSAWTNLVISNNFGSYTGASTVPYNISLSPGIYWMRAYIDSNTNGLPDVGEPLGVFGADGYLTVGSTDVFGADIVIQDTSAAPPSFYISGGVDYYGPDYFETFVVMLWYEGDGINWDTPAYTAEFRWDTTSTSIYFTEIPEPGVYFVGAFGDKNNNGVWDLGEPRSVYGGELYPAPVDVRFGSVDSVNFVLVDLRLSGVVEYYGPDSGNKVVVVKDEAYNTVIDTAVDTGAGFTIDLPSPGSYGLYAYLDKNGNGKEDYAEQHSDYQSYWVEDMISDTLWLPEIYEWEDVDGDGIDDAYETMVWGNLTTAGEATDSDGDGVTDREEFLFKTDPTSAGIKPGTATLSIYVENQTSEVGNMAVILALPSEYTGPIIVYDLAVATPGTYTLNVVQSTYVIFGFIDSNGSGDYEQGEYLKSFGFYSVTGPSAFNAILDNINTTAEVRGTITYPGNQTGTVIVEAFDQQRYAYFAQSYQVTTPGSFPLSFALPVDSGVFELHAYMDVNGNGDEDWDLNEPSGNFIPAGETYVVVLGVNYGETTYGIKIADSETISNVLLKLREPIWPAVQGKVVYSGSQPGITRVMVVDTFALDYVTSASNTYDVNADGSFVIQNAIEGGTSQTVFVVAFRDIDYSRWPDVYQGEPVVVDTTPLLISPDSTVITLSDTLVLNDFSGAFSEFDGFLEYRGTLYDPRAYNAYIEVHSIDGSVNKMDTYSFPNNTYFYYRLPSDTYILIGFLDINGDRTRQSSEPSSDTIVLRLAPWENRYGNPVIISDRGTLSISGTVDLSSPFTGGQLLMGLYTSAQDPSSEPPIRFVTMYNTGSFTISNLPPDTYLLYSFYDENMDYDIGVREARASTTVVLTTSDVSGVDLTLSVPQYYGTITGTVYNISHTDPIIVVASSEGYEPYNLGDAVRRGFAAILPPTADTTVETATYTIAEIPKDRAYFLAAFVDKNRNYLVDPDEPVAFYTDMYGALQTVYFSTLAGTYETAVVDVTLPAEATVAETYSLAGVVALTDTTTEAGFIGHTYNIELFYAEDDPFTGAPIAKVSRTFTATDNLKPFQFAGIVKGYYRIVVVDTANTIFADAAVDLFQNISDFYLEFPKQFANATGETGTAALVGYFDTNTLVETGTTYVVLGLSPDPYSFENGANLGWVSIVDAHTGEFKISNLPANAYYIYAFTDLNRNIEPDPDEPQIIWGDEYGPLNVSLSEGDTKYVYNILMPSFVSIGDNRLIVNLRVVADTEKFLNKYYTINIYRGGDIDLGIVYKTLKKYVTTQDPVSYIFDNMPGDFYHIQVINDSGVVLADGVAEISVDSANADVVVEVDIPKFISGGLGNSAIKGAIVPSVDTAPTIVVLGVSPNGDDLGRGADQGWVAVINPGETEFIIPNIPAGLYFIAAFTDMNGNYEPDLGEPIIVLHDAYGPIGMTVAENDTKIIEQPIEMPAPFNATGTHRIVVVVNLVGDTETLADTFYTVQVYRENDAGADELVKEIDKFISSAPQVTTAGTVPAYQQKYVFVDMPSDYYEIVLINKNNQIEYADEYLLLTDTDAIIYMEFPYQEDVYDYQLAAGAGIGAGNSAIVGQLVGVDTPSATYILLGFDPTPEGFEEGVEAGLIVQPDAQGNFAFNNIPSAGYFLFAWQDENGDLEPQPNEKQYFFGDQFGPKAIFVAENDTVNVGQLVLKAEFKAGGANVAVTGKVVAIEDTANLAGKEYKILVYYPEQDIYRDYPVYESETFVLSSSGVAQVSGLLPIDTYNFVVRDKMGVTYNYVQAEVKDSPTVIEIRIPRVAANGKVYGSLKGRFVNAAGEGLEAVSIFLKNETYSYSAITNAEGNFALSDIIPGTYMVEVSKPGYITFRGMFFVPAGAANLGIKMLKPEASIGGIIRTNNYAEVMVVLTGETDDLNIGDTFAVGSVTLEKRPVILLTDSGVPVNYKIGQLKSGQYRVYVVQRVKLGEFVVVGKYSKIITLNSGEAVSNIDFPYVQVKKAKDITAERLTLLTFEVPAEVIKGDTLVNIVYSLNIPADTIEIKIMKQRQIVYDTVLRGGVGMNYFSVPSVVSDTVGDYIVYIYAARDVDSGTAKISEFANLRVREKNIITYVKVGAGKDASGKLIPAKEGQNLYIFFGLEKVASCTVSIYEQGSSANPIWYGTGYKGDNVVVDTDISGLKAGKNYVVDILANANSIEYRDTTIFALESAEMKATVYAVASEIEKDATAGTVDPIKLGVNLENAETATFSAILYDLLDYVTSKVTGNASALTALDEIDTIIYAGKNTLTWPVNATLASKLEIGKSYLAEVSVSSNGTIKKGAAVFRVVEKGLKITKLLNLFIRSKKLALSADTTIEVRAIFDQSINLADAPQLSVYNLGEGTQRSVPADTVVDKIAIYKVDIKRPDTTPKDYYSLVLSYGGISKVAFLKVYNASQELIGNVIVSPQVFVPGGDIKLNILFTVTENYQNQDVGCTIVTDTGEVVYSFNGGITATIGIINQIEWDGDLGDGKFIAPGIYKIQLSVGQQVKYKVFKIVAQDLTPPKFTIITQRYEGDKIKVVVIASEPLNAAPQVFVGADPLSVSKLENVNAYSGIYDLGASLSTGSNKYTVTVSGADMYGNSGSVTGEFIFQPIKYGEELKTEDGAAVLIDTGALSSGADSELIVTKGEPVDVVGQEDHQFGQNSYDFSIGSEGVDFNKPVQIKLPVSDEDLANMEIDDLNKVKIYYYDEELNRWKFVGGELYEDTSVTPAQKYIIAYVSHLTTFSVGADIVAPDAPTISDSDVEKGVISGVAEPGAVIEILDNNGKVISTIGADEESGEFSINVGQSLAGMSIVALDESGNASQPVALAPASQETPVEYSGTAFAYPNPFGPGSTDKQPYTTIRCDSNASVQIFNIAGELVWSAVDNDAKDKDPSVGYIQWDGTNNDGKQVSSGVYYAIVKYRNKQHDVVKIGFIR